MRLDKYLSEVTGASRNDTKSWLKKGRVTVNGQMEKDGGCKVSPGEDNISLDGAVLSYQKYIYIMLHKPSGVVSATQDNYDKTVVDLVKETENVKKGGSGKALKDIFPVGRLDKDTEGLLLLTNDGDLAHQLLSPKKHVGKCYFAILSDAITKEDQASFEEGLDIGEEKQTMPATLREALPEEMLRENQRQVEGHGVFITIKEGKFHQIKRMAQAIGNKVLYLKRVSMGTLHLDPKLAPGDCRFLTEEEVQDLKRNHFTGKKS